MFAAWQYIKTQKAGLQNHLIIMSARFKTVLIVLSFFSISYCYSQTRIRGKIIDAVTNEPLPFVNINFYGTTIGCVTNTDGIFFLSTTEKVDFIQFCYIGYKDQIISVQKYK